MKPLPPPGGTRLSLPWLAVTYAPVIHGVAPQAQPRRRRLGFFGWLGFIVWFTVFLLWALWPAHSAEWRILDCRGAICEHRPFVYKDRTSCDLDVVSLSRIVPSGTRLRCKEIK